MKILVTGFKRYATHRDNPSELVLPALEKLGVKTCLLDVSYKKAPEELKKAIKEYKPDFIVNLGLSPYRKEPTLEAYAYNETCSTQPDEDKDLRKVASPIEEKGPKSLSCSIDLSSLQQALAVDCLSSSVSIDPGRFVGNQIYYLSLSSGIKSLFVHLPLEADCPLDEQEEALKAIIDYLRLL